MNSSDNQQQNSLVVLPPIEDDWNIFRIFQKIFRAENCTRRMIYWIDEKWGRTRLRKVQKLSPGRSKKDDKLICIYPGEPDLDVAKLAIAGSSIGNVLTGIRWEIYADFECTELLALGRFDPFDLLFSIKKEKAANISQSGLVAIDPSIEAWDFDAMLLTHKCPKCFSTSCDRETLIFDPKRIKCPVCNFDEPRATHNKSLNMIMELMIRLSRPLEGCHNALNGREREFNPVHWLDISATPLLCWIIENIFCGAPISVRINTVDLSKFGPSAVLNLYRRSVFPLLTSSYIRSSFLNFFSRHYHETEKQVRNFHELLADSNQSIPRSDFIERGKQRISELHEEASSLKKAVEVLSEIENWLLQSATDEPWYQTKTEAVIEAVQVFPTFINRIAEIVGDEYLQEAEERAHV